MRREDWGRVLAVLAAGDPPTRGRIGAVRLMNEFRTDSQFGYRMLAWDAFISRCYEMRWP